MDYIKILRSSYKSKLNSYIFFTVATTIDQGEITLQAKTQHYKNCLVVPNGIISSE